MGAVSRSRLREVFVGSTAERILDRMPCDVLIVRSADFRAQLPF
jgi:nucleotide-binding universal stress UspA family protein